MSFLFKLFFVFFFFVKVIYELTKDGLWEVSGSFPIFMNLYSLKTFEIFKILDGNKMDKKI